MKLAITGTSNIGKTTLAKALSDFHGLTLIHEDFRGIEDAMTSLRKIPTGNKKQLIKASNKLYDEINVWLFNRMKYFDSAVPIIEDRFCLDVVIYLANPITQIPEIQLKEFLQKCNHYTTVYDAVIIPPITNTSDNDSLNEDGLIRLNSLSSKIVSHSILIGLTEQFCSAPKIYIPPNCNSTEDRINFINDRLNALRVRK